MILVFLFHRVGNRRFRFDIRGIVTDSCAPAIVLLSGGISPCLHRTATCSPVTAKLPRARCKRFANLHRFTTRQLPEFLRDSARGKRTFVKMCENSSDRETTSGLIHIFKKSSQLPSDSEKLNILLQKAMLRNFSYIYIIENCSCEMKIKGNFSLHTKKKRNIIYARRVLPCRLFV